LSSLVEDRLPASTEAGPTGRRPKISILLLTYNHVKYIGQALDSILMQKTEYDYVIHVVEDCSTDGTQDVIMRYVREHAGIVKPFLNSQNLGKLDPPSKKLQKCLYQHYKQLDGDYIALLEGDDYWSSPHKLQSQVSFLEANLDFAAAAHNTIKIYDDGSGREPHRFPLAQDSRAIRTIHDFIDMTSFFHLSSILYRNVFKGHPPVGFRSKWSCDIFWTIAYLQYGKLHYADEDMSVYRHHKAGVFSQLAEVAGRIYNIEGIRRYNRWLGYRYAKGFAFTLNRLCLDLLRRTKDGRLPPLKQRQRLKYSAIALLHGVIYDAFHAFPRFDPAVFWYGEAIQPPDPWARRALRLVGFLK
jgi:glycosyltransferase involved in cell wall biosynthesis